MSFKNYYEVLGVSPKAPADEIKEAYREMASKYKNANNALDEYSQMMLGNINEAVEVLANPEKRAAYDKTLALIDEGTKAAAVHGDIRTKDIALINEASERYFEQEKHVANKHQQYLAAKNTKPATYFTTVKVLLCLILIGGTTFYFHPDYFEFVKGTPVEEQKVYEWITNDTTLIYAKPKKKAKVIFGVAKNTGFNVIDETTYYYKVAFIDEKGNNKSGYIKKDNLEKNKELILAP